MSSTNRSEARKEHKSDYYVTPQYAIRDFVKEFLKVETLYTGSYFLGRCTRSPPSFFYLTEKYP